MFHLFSSDISSISLPNAFTCPFCYQPHPLCIIAKNEVINYVEQQSNLIESAKEGKMFGVLVVQNERNEIGFVSAFSGQLAGKNRLDYFVPPVFDILEDRKFYIDEDITISNINQEIKNIENSAEFILSLNCIQKYTEEKRAQLVSAKEEMYRAKLERDRKRETGISEIELQQLVKESQFQKAEYKRLERHYNDLINVETQRHTILLEQICALKQKRKRLSAELQEKLFSGFIFYNAEGKQKSLFDIFKEYKNALPPAGAGECAAPRLLQYAYNNKLQPIAMAEFWYGKSPKQEIKIHGNFYPACKHKCEPILTFMLQGLHVEENRLIKSNLNISTLYEDDTILVIDKPSGMLSIPGTDGQKSALDFAKEHCQSNLFIVHRLDMDTSGILVFAKTEDAQINLQKQFANRQTQKKYVALLEGTPTKQIGTISLPLIPDIHNRPYQIVDFENGKQAETQFEIIEQKETLTRIAFFPKTGRTHQLRVHAAHQLGLACPIVGDNLYGKPADRLYLHAEQLQIIHPKTNEYITFTCNSPF